MLEGTVTCWQCKVQHGSYSLKAHFPGHATSHPQFLYLFLPLSSQQHGSNRWPSQLLLLLWAICSKRSLSPRKNTSTSEGRMPSKLLTSIILLECKQTWRPRFFRFCSFEPRRKLRCQGYPCWHETTCQQKQSPKVIAIRQTYFSLQTHNMFFIRNRPFTINRAHILYFEAGIEDLATLQGAVLHDTGN